MSDAVLLVVNVISSRSESFAHSGKVGIIQSANSTKSFWTHPKRPGFACVRSFQCIDNQWILKVPRYLPETLENSMPPCRVFLQAKEHAALWIHLPHPKASKEKLLSDSQQRRCEASRCLDVNLKDSKSSLRPMDRRLLLLILHVAIPTKHPVFFNSSQPFDGSLHHAMPLEIAIAFTFSVELSAFSLELSGLS